MIKYDGKSLLLSVVKSGYNNVLDSKFGDETHMPVFNGLFQSQKWKLSIFDIVDNLNQYKYTDTFSRV